MVRLTDIQLGYSCSHNFEALGCREFDVSQSRKSYLRLETLIYLIDQLNFATMLTIDRSKSVLVVECDDKHTILGRCDR